MIHLWHFFTGTLQPLLYLYQMHQGLIFGKFYPLHLGHLALFEFGRKHCDRLQIMICAEHSESIPGAIREAWVRESAREKEDVQVSLFP